MIRKKLDDLKNKFTERANTLFTSMKDNDEEDYEIQTQSKIRGLGTKKETEEIECELSPLVDKDTRKKYNILTEDKETKTKRLEEEKDYRKFADLLYPTMKDKEEKKEESLDKINIKKEEIEPDNLTKKPFKNKLQTEQTKKSDKTNRKIPDNANNIKNVKYSDIKYSAKNDNDKNFFSALDIVFNSEGNYVNDKDDKGGPTNMGVTQKTYDDYCKRYKLPQKDVKNLTRNETIKVYYNDYWIKTGLNKEKDPIKSLVLFDTAVLHGVGRAKEYNKKSNGNIREILELRREHYKNKVKKDPSQKKFLKGWNNRVDKLEKILNRYEGLE